MRSILLTFGIVILCEGLGMGGKVNGHPAGSRKPLPDDHGAFFEPSLTSRDSNMILLGHWPEGPVHEVFVRGTQAYVLSGGQMLVVDVDDPANPVILGKTRFRYLPVQIYVEADFAYVGTPNGWLYVVNVAQPESPRIVYEFFTGARRIYDVVVAKQRLYLCLKFDGLFVLDVTNPINPEAIRWYVDQWRPMELIVQDTLAYMADDKWDFVVLNLIDPAAIQEINQSSREDDGFAIAYANHRVFLKNDDNEIFVFDVTNPNHPIYLSYAWTDEALDIAAIDTLLFLSDDEGRLNIYSVDTHGEVTLQCSLAVGDPYHVFLANDRMYLSNHRYGMQIWEYQFPANPVRIGQMPLGGITRDVDVQNGWMYVANGNKGLRVVDMRDASYPITVGEFPGGSFAEDVQVRFPYAYVLDRDSGLYIYNVEDSLQPVPVARVSPQSRYRVYGGVDVQDTLVYLGSSNDLVILNVKNPSQPVVVGTYSANTYGWIEEVVVQDTLAVLTYGYYGVWIVNVRDPVHPQFMSRLAFEVRDVAIQDTLLYVASGEAGITIWNIRNPRFPFQVGSYATGYYATDVHVSGNMLYTLDWYHGLKALDVTDPGNPELLGQYRLGSGALELDVWRDTVYVASPELGVLVFKIGKAVFLPQHNIQRPRFYLYPNYPNPFNAQTRIVYTLKRRTYVELSIYDSQGRSLRTLVQEVQGPGSYAVVWDGRDQQGRLMASGVYFYRLKTNTQQALRKMILLR